MTRDEKGVSRDSPTRERGRTATHCLGRALCLGVPVSLCVSMFPPELVRLGKGPWWPARPCVRLSACLQEAQWQQEWQKWLAQTQCRPTRSHEPANCCSVLLRPSILASQYFKTLMTASTKTGSVPARRLRLAIADRRRRAVVATARPREGNSLLPRSRFLPLR